MGQTSDSTYLFRLKTELLLSEQQYKSIDSCYKATALQLADIEKELQALARKDTPDTEKDVLRTSLNAKKKELKVRREEFLLSLLSAEQYTLYKEKIKPDKPPVLHMGINHDRLNCNVCIKN